MKEREDNEEESSIISVNPFLPMVHMQFSQNLENQHGWTDAMCPNPKPANLTRYIEKVTVVLTSIKFFLLSCANKSLII